MTKPTHVHENHFRTLLMLAKILAFLGLGGCTPQMVPDERERLHAAAEKDVIAVLFIGNSYSYGIPAAFRKVAESHGRKVRVGHSTYGGWTLAKHMGNAATVRKLREGKWDVVVIQEQSLIPSRDEKWRKAMDSGVRFFVQEARAAGAVPMLYQTWGRRDGDPDVEGDDFYMMNKRVRSGYATASRGAGNVSIARVGDAWEREFRAGRGSELYVADGSHPSALGNVVTANVFYTAIFGEPSQD